METDPAASINKHFANLEDPRVDRTKLHKLIDILVIAICAVICGADNWEEVELFGQAKEAWFKTFLALPNGIPSHDTFWRVFARLDPQQFQHSFVSWIASVGEVTKGQVVAIDGKTLRRSHDKTLGRGAIDMVSAWAAENRLVLGQVKVDDKSNEIRAVPELLQVLEISGCIVTIDALGCQKEIAEAIIAQEADYVLALKENHGRLYQDVVKLFADLEASNFKAYAYSQDRTVNKNHGRLETRTCQVIADQQILMQLRDAPEWKGLQSVVKVHARRQMGDEVTEKERYFLSSLVSNARHLLNVVRSHWSIENELHWVLDIAFREDESRIRKDHGPENFALLRHIALNLVKQEKTQKASVKGKRLKAGWDEDYLLKILSGLF
ncbi:MAG TPA: ISAs1 family transposase [Anaerolineales bacterium]|nr:ISAs1 family transposase [Anaerolineales bacterium]